MKHLSKYLFMLIGIFYLTSCSSSHALKHKESSKGIDIKKLDVDLKNKRIYHKESRKLFTGKVSINLKRSIVYNYNVKQGRINDAYFWKDGMMIQSKFKNEKLKLIHAKREKDAIDYQIYIKKSKLDRIKVKRYDYDADFKYRKGKLHSFVIEGTDGHSVKMKNDYVTGKELKTGKITRKNISKSFVFQHLIKRIEKPYYVVKKLSYGLHYYLLYTQSDSKLSAQECKQILGVKTYNILNQLYGDKTAATVECLKRLQK